MMKVAVFPNPWSTSWFRENLQEGEYYGERRTLSEEAGFINCLGARSEDMVSGAWPCLDKPGAAHQEVRRAKNNQFQSKQQRWFWSQRGIIVIIWCGLEVESNDRKPPLMRPATKHDDGGPIGEEVERKIGLRENCCRQIGLLLDSLMQDKWQSGQICLTKHTQSLRSAS